MVVFFFGKVDLLFTKIATASYFNFVDRRYNHIDTCNVIHISLKDFIIKALGLQPGKKFSISRIRNAIV